MFKNIKIITKGLSKNTLLKKGNKITILRYKKNNQTSLTYPEFVANLKSSKTNTTFKIFNNFNFWSVYNFKRKLN